MKKFLSLVLALVMTMSLVTISAGAKDFTDDDSITYSEAIDVMSAVKVVEGYPDGSFNPSKILTRAEAAKIICNMILGPTTASALKADTAPFKDVPADHWAAGYIAYCAQQGIIKGYGNGVFGVNDNLDGHSFMKMLLCALGYDAEVEGFVGGNWTVNVAKQALAIGLDGGLKDDFNGIKGVTREEACLYAFNTLKADLVEYGSKTTVSVGGAEVVIAGTSAKAVSWTTSAAADGNIDETVDGLGARVGDGYIQFAEQYFNKLVKSTVRDAFGRPATKWTNKGSNIGTYAKAASKTYAKSVALSDIYADLGMTTTDTTASLYENGALSLTNLTVSKTNDSTKLKDLGDQITGNGTIVEVFLNSDTNHVDICAISVYVGEVTKVVDATKTKDAHILINDLSGNVDMPTGTFNDEFKTTDFAEDDIVAFTYSYTDDAIKTVSKMETVDGTLTKRAVTSSLTLGEKTYKYAKNVAFGGGLDDETDLVIKSDYTVYLDASGYALYVVETDAAISNYALVLAVGTTFDADKAKLVLSDGTKKTVSTAKDYSATLVAGDIVSYKVESDGSYRLSKRGNAINTWATDTAGATKQYNANLAINKKNSEITINSATVNDTATTKIYADSATVFVLQQDGGDFKVYTGIKNVPNIDGDNAGATTTQVSFLCKTGTKASIVFISTVSANVTGGSNDVVFVAGKSRSDYIVDADNNEYYEYNAVVNGEITTVKVATPACSGTVSGLSTGTKPYGVLFDSYSLDTDDLMISATSAFGGTVSQGNGVGVKKMVGEYSVRVDTASTDLLLTVAKDANVYYVDEDGEIKSITLNQVKTDADDRVYYTLEGGEITNLFVVEKN